VGPVGHQGSEKVEDQVRGHTVHPVPYRVGGHVQSRGRREGRAAPGPSYLVQREREAVPEWEQDSIDKPGRFTWEEVVEERQVELGRGGRSGEFRETGRRATDGKLFGRPHCLRGCRGREGGPVVPFCLFNSLEIGGPCSPHPGEEGGVETVTLCGAESGVVGLSEQR